MVAENGCGSVLGVQRVHRFCRCRLDRKARQLAMDGVARVRRGGCRLAGEDAHAVTPGAEVLGDVMTLQLVAARCQWREVVRDEEDVHVAAMTRSPAAGAGR